MIGIYEVLIPLVCAVALMIMGLVSTQLSIVYSIMSVVFWFVSGILWLIDGGVSAVAFLFMGIGIIMTLIVISEGMEEMKKQVQENLPDDQI